MPTKPGSWSCSCPDCLLIEWWTQMSDLGLAVAEAAVRWWCWWRAEAVTGRGPWRSSTMTVVEGQETGQQGHIRQRRMRRGHCHGLLVCSPGVIACANFFLGAKNSGSLPPVSSWQKQITTNSLITAQCYATMYCYARSYVCPSVRLWRWGILVT